MSNPSNSLTTSDSDPKNSLRVAFEPIEAPGWTGGLVYMQNLLKAMSMLDPAERPFTLLTHYRGDPPYNALADKYLEIPRQPRGLGARILKKIARQTATRIGLRPQIASLLATEGVDAFFTCIIYPPSVRVPLIGWIPDFQYVHMPEIGGVEHARESERGHRELIRQSAAILVSSNDVLKDLAIFSPPAVARAHVLQFVAQVPGDVYNTDPAGICQKYSLPQRFFYLPNQFWKHKNHLLVIKALQILKKRSADITVICTGNTHDNRNPAFFPSLLAEIALAGVHDSFVALGMVPRTDVFALQRQSLSILQPSLFEGWSTSIEEAKSLGKRVIASDLDVHREQIPDADFFARSNPEALADCLEAVAKQALPGPDLPREARARGELPERTRQFARRFLSVVKQVRHP